MTCTIELADNISKLEPMEPEIGDGAGTGVCVAVEYIHCDIVLVDLRSMSYEAEG